MGISWGGFNCLQVAALKPQALKAVISIASKVYRYNDASITRRHASFGAIVLARPCSPTIAPAGSRDRRRRLADMWLERLEDEPFFMGTGWPISAPRRILAARIIAEFDGSLPALVRGLGHGYRNTVR